MRYGKSRMSVLSGVIGLAAITGIAVWQFYVFVTFRNAVGVIDQQGGILHLWLAIGILLIDCVVAFFFFSVFLKYDKSDELHITSPPPRRKVS